MLISKGRLSAMLDNLSTLNQETENNKQRITDLEKRTQILGESKECSLTTFYAGNGAYYQHLHINLAGSALSEFQKQPFYQGLKEYLGAHEEVEEPKREKQNPSDSLISELDKAIDRSIKKMRDATYGYEVRTFITEYEELMLKKSDEVTKRFLKQDKK